MPSMSRLYQIILALLVISALVRILLLILG